MRAAVNTVTNARFTMDYCKFGEGDGIFVIIPGISIKSVMDSANAVAGQYKDMASDYTIYVFDRRKDLPDTYTIRDMARDTAEAMMELGLKGVNLFGASQGGMISMVIAIEYPELVSHLVLGSTASDLTDCSSVVLDWIRMAEEKDVTGLCRSFGEKVYPAEFYEKFKDAFDALAAMVTDEDLRRFLIIAKGCEGFNVTGDLNKIKCPVFVLGAADDAVLGSAPTDAIMAAFDGREDVYCHVYDGYGHAAFDMAPDYRDRIKDFLRK